MQKLWSETQRYIDEDRYAMVQQLLKIQYQEACWWRDACLLYFQTFSRQEIPSMIKPSHTLEYYQQLEFPFAPGIRPKW